MGLLTWEMPFPHPSRWVVCLRVFLVSERRRLSLLLLTWVLCLTCLGCGQCAYADFAGGDVAKVASCEQQGSSSLSTSTLGWHSIIVDGVLIPIILVVAATS